MAYLKPPLFQRRVFNPLAMRFGIGGAVTLVVPGRRTGHLEKVPVIPVEHDGARYLVSTRGESNWVRNLRAAGGKAMEPRRERTVPRHRGSRRRTTAHHRRLPLRGGQDRGRVLREVARSRRPPGLPDRTRHRVAPGAPVSARSAEHGFLLGGQGAPPARALPARELVVALVAEMNAALARLA